MDNFTWRQLHSFFQNSNLSSAFAPFSQVQSQQQANTTHFAQSLFTPSLLDILGHGNGNVCRSMTAMQHAEEAPTSSLCLTPAIAEALQALASNAVQTSSPSLNSQFNSAQQTSIEQQPHAKRVKTTDNGNGNVPLPVTPNKRPQSLIQVRILCKQGYLKSLIRSNNYCCNRLSEKCKIVIFMLFSFFVSSSCFNFWSQHFFWY